MLCNEGNGHCLEFVIIMSENYGYLYMIPVIELRDNLKDLMNISTDETARLYRRF